VGYYQLQLNIRFVLKIPNGGSSISGRAFFLPQGVMGKRLDEPRMISERKTLNSQGL
jgi:hypothetical protein